VLKYKSIITDDSVINLVYDSMLYAIDPVTLMLNDTQQYDIAVTTLFKDDFYLISVFCDYYRKKGVDHFYLYYNGIINNEILALCAPEYITLREWNFPYSLANDSLQHHAQLGQIHHALHICTAKYMIFCDLDEYVDINLRELTTEPQHCFAFENRWCKTVDKTRQPEFPTDFLARAYTHKYPSHSKCMYKVSEVNVVGIHKPATEITIKIVGCIYHFFSWSRPNRKITGVFVAMHV
jgi:hypothetical protein